MNKVISLKEMISANRQDQVIRTIKETGSFLKAVRRFEITSNY